MSSLGVARVNSRYPPDVPEPASPLEHVSESLAQTPFCCSSSSLQVTNSMTESVFVTDHARPTVQRDDASGLLWEGPKVHTTKICFEPWGLRGCLIAQNDRSSISS